VPWQQRIDGQGTLLAGKAHIRGVSLSVEEVLDRMSRGESVCDIMAAYPGITWEDMYACFAFARDMLRQHSHETTVV